MKILVVDDEYYARKVTLKYILEWNQQIDTFEAENGLEALEILEEEHIDIVLADIRMPQMDGIELSKRIADLYPGIRIILITGFADFHYAKDAIRYKVKQYLLKPLKRLELQQSLEECSQEIQKQTYAEQQYEHDILNQVVLNKTKRLLTHKDRMTRQLESLSHFFLGIILLNNEVDGMEVYMNQLMIDTKQSIIFKSNQVPNQWNVIFRFSDCNFLSEEEQRQKIMIQLKKIIFFMQKSTEVNLCIAVSSVKNCFADLPIAYSEANEALKYRLVQGVGKLYDFTEVMQYNYSSSLLDADTRKLLLEYLSQGNYDWIKQYVKRIFHQVKIQEKTPFSVLNDFCVELMNVMNTKIKQIQSTHMDELLHWQIEYMSFFSQNELLEFLIHRVEIICHEIIEMKKEINPSLIDDLKAFIDKNYVGEISLEGVAKHRYFVNASYLSRLFKEETGESFSRYLTSVRMKNAKDLVSNHDIPLSEIGAIVGYTDYSYFIKVFKKYYGITPKQMRGK